MADRLRALLSVDRLATVVARAELAERRVELLAGAADEPRPHGADALAAALWAGDAPVVRRIAGGRRLLDPRTLARDELHAAAEAVVVARR